MGNTQLNTDPIEQLFTESLQWRCIGPHRGGRVVAVTGHPTDPMVFYFGASAGGVWKTNDGGTYWHNISDGFLKTAAVGAIAISQSDPNVLYVGTGEACIRGDVSHGDGVYKSTDGGDTWENIGLTDTRHISRIRIHPTNPNVVYVAALGHAFGSNTQRGVFKSNDGGQSWEHVLFKSDNAGAADLYMDPTNPRILYASIWEAQRYAWTLKSGGPDSGLHKSVDGGSTWTDISNNPGLPIGIKGRMGITSSPARPNRVWAIIESEEKGIYRSEDAGETWELVSKDGLLLARPWYYSHIFAHPNDSNTVYVLSFNIFKSTDGGNNFEKLITPHGDLHDLWIDPNNPRRLIHGSDGGASISFNDCETWSTIYNQPTSQFYQAVTDNQSPYHVYSTQQDNTAIAVPSRSYKGSILFSDCYVVGSSESGHIAVRPDDHNIVYSGAIGSSPGGGDSLLRYDHKTGQVRVISVWPEYNYGWGVGDNKYRFQWTYPIEISPHDPNVLYVAAHVVLRSENEGKNWDVISPDLTRNDKTKMGPAGGPITHDTTGVENYGTIFALAESPHEKGVFWAGSDDGLVHISRDGSKNWENVTPKDLPEWSLINRIEISPHDPSKAYLAVTRYKFNDTHPYLYKTTNYGKTWTNITNGLPEDDFTRVIREDTVVPGLLFAGTETGVYVSFNDGELWQSLQRNLPVVPIHDLTIKMNDLIAGTHGRSFWVLDNLEVLRQINKDLSSSKFHLFKPPTTDRIAPEMGVARTYGAGNKYMLGLGIPSRYHDGKTDQGEDTLIFVDSGKNPPDGVVVTYYLSHKPSSKISMEFCDSDGNTIRTFTSESCKDKLRAEKGMNRQIWDMRHEPARPIPEDEEFETALNGPLVPPGTYEVKLTIGETDQSQTFELVTDPKISVTVKDLNEQRDFLIQIRDLLSKTHDAIGRIRKTREQIEDLESKLEEPKKYRTIIESAGSIKSKLLEIENELVQTKSDGKSDMLHLPSRLNRKIAELASVPGSADAVPTQGARNVFENLSEKLQVQLDKLDLVFKEDLTRFTKNVQSTEIPIVTTLDS